jgi:hypothetical protein
VKSVEADTKLTVAANFTSFNTSVWMDACPVTCVIHCAGPQIIGVASADVSPDGTFKLELPDFSNDPMFAHDPSAELEFRVNGIKGPLLLQPEGSQRITISVAPSYPYLLLVPVKWKGLREKTE